MIHLNNIYEKFNLNPQPNYIFDVPTKSNPVEEISEEELKVLFNLSPDNIQGKTMQGMANRFYVIFKEKLKENRTARHLQIAHFLNNLTHPILKDLLLYSQQTTLITWAISFIQDNHSIQELNANFFSISMTADIAQKVLNQIVNYNLQKQMRSIYQESLRIWQSEFVQELELLKKQETYQINILEYSIKQGVEINSYLKRGIKLTVAKYDFFVYI